MKVLAATVLMTGGLWLAASDSRESSSVPTASQSAVAQQGLAGVSTFWAAVAKCETGSKWDWGARHRKDEGKMYEGGVGFAASTWRLWAGQLGLLRRFPHAYLAPPAVQILVAHYGLVIWTDARGFHGYWGCIETYPWIARLPGR